MKTKKKQPKTATKRDDWRSRIKKNDPLGTSAGIQIGHAQVVGVNIKSRMLRVDAEFANWLRREANKNGISVTEASRALLADLTPNG